MRMRYMSIIANLTLSPNTLGYPTAGPIRDNWEDFVSERVIMHQYQPNQTYTYQSVWQSLSSGCFIVSHNFLMLSYLS